MNHASPEIVSFSRQFNNSDELFELVKGWDLDFCQLDRGNSRAELFQYHTPHVQLGMASFSRQYHQRGTSPAGLTFAFLEDGVQQMSWHNHDVNDSSLLVYPSRGEINCVSARGFRVYTLTYDVDVLQQLEHSLQSGDQIKQLIGTNTALTVDPKGIRGIRHQIQYVTAQLQRNPQVLREAGLRHQIEREIPRRIIHLMSSGTRLKPVASPRKRSQGLKRAIEFIEAAADEAITMDVLCQHCGVSDRTLEYAFRDRFGITPVAYIKATRLHRVRDFLYKRRGTGVKITDAANHWGFWHMGQFSADYRRFFGELPSQTINSHHRKIQHNLYT